MSEFWTKGIRLNIEAGDNGLFYGTSRDVKGLIVAKPSFEEVLSSVPDALEELRAAKAVEACRLSDQ